MKNTHYFRLFYIIACIWGLLCSPVIVSAEETAEVDFAIKAVIPDNQTEGDHTYFDLMMKASQKQTIEVEIWNLKNQEIQIEAQVCSATTNQNGVIEYGKRDGLPDDTLSHQMEDIISCDSLITVPANDTTRFELDIQMPEEKYEGLLVGGVTFQLAGNGESEEADSTDGLAIQNTYSYVIGIVLRESEKELQPQLLLNDVSYEKEGDTPTISANIQNIVAAYVNDLEVEARITRKGTTGTLYQTTKEDMRMAPNSNMDFQIDLNGSSLNDGAFTLYVNAKTDDREWCWEKDFTIDSGVAYAEETKTYEKKTTGYGWLFAVAFLVLLASGIIVYRYRRMLKIKRNYKKIIIKEL